MTGEMKFIFHAYWEEGDPRQFQLFNLTADPYELQVRSHGLYLQSSPWRIPTAAVG